MGQQQLDNHNNRENQNAPQYPQNMNMNPKNMYQRNSQMLHHQPPQPPYPQQRHQNYPQSPQSSQYQHYQQQQQQQGRPAPMSGRAQRQSFPVNDQSEYSDYNYNNGGSRSARNGNGERDRERQEYGQQLFNDNNGYNQNGRGYDPRQGQTDYNRGSMNKPNYSNDYSIKSQGSGSSYSSFGSSPSPGSGSLNSGYTSGAQSSQSQQAANQLNNQNVLNKNKLYNQSIRNNNNQSMSSFNSATTDRSRAVR